MSGVDQIKPWYAQAFEMVEGTLQYKEETAFAGACCPLLARGFAA